MHRLLLRHVNVIHRIIHVKKKKKEGGGGRVDLFKDHNQFRQREFFLALNRLLYILFYRLGILTAYALRIDMQNNQQF